jgi:hypothetical protein
MDADVRGTHVPARTACAALALLVLLQGLAFAQDVTAPALKAAFIYNFAKFTEWPADGLPNAEPFVICVLGDSAVADALEQTVKGRMLAGHNITVSHVAPVGGTRVCPVLYVSGMTTAQAARAVSGLRDAPVLTISDVEGFADAGGIAQFFFERGRLRFSVHIDSAKRARLQISSRLLALSTTP